MKVRYSREAIADLIGIADYIREHNPRAAEAVEKRIQASIDQLETFPLIGRPTDDPEVMGGEVVIHHIRHGRREPLDPGAARSE